MAAHFRSGLEVTEEVITQFFTNLQERKKGRLEVWMPHVEVKRTHRVSVFQACREPYPLGSLLAAATGPDTPRLTGTGTRGCPNGQDFSQSFREIMKTQLVTGGSPVGAGPTGRDLRAVRDTGGRGQVRPCVFRLGARSDGRRSADPRDTLPSHQRGRTLGVN